MKAPIVKDDIPTIMDEYERENMWLGRHSYRDMLYADRSATPTDIRLAHILTPTVVLMSEDEGWGGGGWNDGIWRDLEEYAEAWTERGNHVRRVYKVYTLK